MTLKKKKEGIYRIQGTKEINACPRHLCSNDMLFFLPYYEPISPSPFSTISFQMRKNSHFINYPQYPQHPIYAFQYSIQHPLKCSLTTNCYFFSFIDSCNYSPLENQTNNKFTCIEERKESNPIIFFRNHTQLPKIYNNSNTQVN